MKTHTLALLLLGLALGFPLTLVLARGLQARSGVVEVHARVAETGGWTPDTLSAEAGKPLSLRLTSDDVVHGFAIGQSDAPPIDLEPGRPVETTVTFSRPGKYVFYCTRWCGPNHWRMRGTIEVSGTATSTEPASVPLYLSLGLDLDAPHPADPPPAERPSASRGAQVSRSVPASILPSGDLRAESPAQVWRRLREAPETGARTDQELWDLVAYAWRSATTTDALTEGRALFASNCAACHGEGGGGDGVMASSMPAPTPASMERGHAAATPANFRDTQRMLGASPAVLQGKILRGGMGTGMPYWGPIFTQAETWALVDYLWSLSMDYEEVR